MRNVPGAAGWRRAPRRGGSWSSPRSRALWPCVVGVAIPCGGRFGPGPAWQGDVVLGDVQYPTLWLPVGLIGAVLVGAAVWPGERFTRAVVALALIGLVIVGYMVLPSVFDVDTLFRE